MPVDGGGPVVTTLVWFLNFPREAVGALRTRHSLRPLLPGGRYRFSSPGALRVAGRHCLVIARSVSDEAIQLTLWIASLALAMTEIGCLTFE